MAFQGGLPRGDLQDVLKEAADRLATLQSSTIARKAFLDEDDPDDLEALAALTLDIARALDPIFQEISYRGRLGSRSKASPHALYVTNALKGNLDFELRDRAERIVARHGHRLDKEHRLSAIDLGVGPYK